MSHYTNDFLNVDLDKRFLQSKTNTLDINPYDFTSSPFKDNLTNNTTINEETQKQTVLISSLVSENKNLQNIIFFHENNNKKNTENNNILQQENSKLKFSLETIKKFDFENIFANFQTEKHLITDKIKLIETEYTNEIFDLKQNIFFLKSQIEEINNQNISNLSTNNNYSAKTNEEIKFYKTQIIDLQNSLEKEKQFSSNKNLIIKIQEENLTEIKSLQEKLETEKTNYGNLLVMNQDLGKKIIDNIKINNENKSEIQNLKTQLLTNQKGYLIKDNDFSDFEIDILKEDRNKSNEIRSSLEKINNEQMNSIITLNQKLKESEIKSENLFKEIENLRKINHSNLFPNQNFSANMIVNNTNNDIKTNNKIHENQIRELKNQKIILENEIFSLKNKLKDQETTLILLGAAHEKDKYKLLETSMHSSFRDDRSNILSRITATNLNQSKFLDSKIKDLEESIIMEKENSENIVKIKQNLIDRLKKNNDTITEERNKLHKELSEEKMKIHSLVMEKNNLLDNESFLKEQIQDLNSEICELRLQMDLFDQLQDRLYEYERQFEMMGNNLNNIENNKINIQQLMNENEEINNLKNIISNLETEINLKNIELTKSKEKACYLEKDIEGKIIQFTQFTNLIQNDVNLKISEYEKNIKISQEENNELKKTIEDSKIIIFSLREKCKEVINKDQEILQLKNILQEIQENKNFQINQNFQKNKISSSAIPAFGNENLNISHQNQQPPPEIYTNIPIVKPLQINPISSAMGQGGSSIIEEFNTDKLKSILEEQNNLFNKYKNPSHAFKNPFLEYESYQEKNKTNPYVSQDQIKDLNFSMKELNLNTLSPNKVNSINNSIGNNNLNFEQQNFTTDKNIGLGNNIELENYDRILNQNSELGNNSNVYAGSFNSLETDIYNEEKNRSNKVLRETNYEKVDNEGSFNLLNENFENNNLLDLVQDENKKENIKNN